MRGILINAAEQTITEVEHTGTIADTIGCERVTCVPLHTFKRGEAGVSSIDLWIDDEGLLCEPEHGFEIGGNVYVGNGVILDCDWHGASVGTRLPLEAVTHEVTWRTFDEGHAAPDIYFEVM